MESATPPEVLNDAELAGLTRKVRPTAQIRALKQLNIPHLVRSEGSVIVYRSSLHDQSGTSNTRRKRDRVHVDTSQL